MGAPEKLVICLPAGRLCRQGCGSLTHSPTTLHSPLLTHSFTILHRPLILLLSYTYTQSHLLTTLQYTFPYTLTCSNNLSVHLPLLSHVLSTVHNQLYSFTHLQTYTISYSFNFFVYLTAYIHSSLLTISLATPKQ